MNKAVRLLIFLIVLVFLIAAQKYVDIQVVGLRGKVLKNVVTRIEEYREHQSNFEDEDLKQQIKKAMQPYGFFKPSITILRQNSHIKAKVSRGPLLKIAKFTLEIYGEGESNYAFKKQVQKIPIKVGDAFSNPNYEATKHLLISAADQEGYIHAHFEKAEIEIDEKLYCAYIRLKFNTGPRYYFGQVRFDPTNISPELLHKYVPFKYNEPYSTDKLLALNDALIKSGYFKSVNLKPVEANGSILPIEAHLESVSPFSYSAGLGYGTDTGPRGRASMQVLPIDSHGDKFSLVTLGSMKENLLQAQYIRPSSHPLTDQYELTANLSNLNYNSGYSNSLLTALALRHTKNSFQRVLSLNNLYERFNYTDQPTHKNYNLFPKASFSWQNKSSLIFSPEGYNLNLNGLASSKSILSNVSFSQVSIDAKAAVYFDKLRTRLYGHAIGGLTQISNIDQLPLSLALLLGGTDNLKAFNYNSLGPGKVLGYGGLELQKETIKSLYVLGFIDTGYVSNIANTFQRDVGLGLMWVSPIGPIKIGLAQQVDNQFHPVATKTPKLFINIGPDL